MLREILERILNEFCLEAREFSEKVKGRRGWVRVRDDQGNEYKVEADASILNGFIPAKDSKGKWVELNLCGENDFEVL